MAKLELQDAVDYYELEQFGLGKRFKTEMQTSLLRIVRYPDVWPIEKDHIFIVAISHQHRRPYYWVDKELK